MANKPHSTSHEPKKMEYKEIKEITGDFDESRKIGSGRFGTVYKGVRHDGQMVAVKVFHLERLLGDSQFQEELMSLSTPKHQNIVKLVGFCIESEKEPWKFEAKQDTGHSMQTALCLEYLDGGSLENHISDANTELDWGTCYKIIRGVCEGLKYLHKGQDPPIWHLNLKPYNILLDNKMVPKISDFGLSKLFHVEKETVNSEYCPPEYKERNKTSPEYDIFSLGVVIVKIMAGHKGYDLFWEMGTEKFVDKVHDNWRLKIDRNLSPTSCEAYCKQVKRSIEIGLKCIDWIPLDRPTIEHIVSTLTETEQVILDLGQQIEQSHEEDPIFLENDKQKSDSTEIVEDLSTTKTKESELRIPSTLQKELQLDLLKRITDDFSKKHELGGDDFATAYKAIHEDRKEIVVKVLKEKSPVPRPTVFINEIKNIMALSHENIVRFVGYCTEAQRNEVQNEVTYSITENDACLLCYEYLPRGSVDKYIFATDESSKPEWDQRFKIINGICDGLHFLHTENQIIHMDLKPKNVLLDYNMVAKIVGFGLSRVISNEHAQEIIQDVVGSYGYIAPEYLYRGEISTQTDIYSLGVTIIEITTMKRNSGNHSDPSARIFIEKVREEWTYDHVVSAYPTEDAILLKQIIACIEIGLQCVEIDRKKRPSIEDIVNKISCAFTC